jgi:hypothetical protein
MKKGFISAPLAGTIIFLACVLLIVNMSRAEANDVTSLVSDSYHNRIVSLLETYRSDLASIFRAGLSRNLEFWLAEPGWLSQYTYSNKVGSGSEQPIGDGTPCDLNGDNQLDLSELRLCHCVSQSELMNQIICNVGADPTQNERYNMQKWFEFILTDTYFEGIKFTVANRKQVEELIDVTQAAQYVEFCKKLIGASMFDCKKFYETADMQCCKTPTTQLSGSSISFPNECSPEDVLPGCDKGTFFVKINVLDPEIYPRMPRILAEDAKGNQVRSGALADENFVLPIQYPFYYYEAAAIDYYSYLAYGETQSTTTPKPGQNPDSATCEGRQEGIVDGLCVQSISGGCNDIKTAPPDLTPVFTCNDADYNPLVQDTEDAVRDELVNAFFTKAFKEACKHYTPAGSSLGLLGGVGENSEGIQTQLCDACSDNTWGADGWFNCNTSTTEVKDYFSSRARVPNCLAGHCAYFGDFELYIRQLRFVDSRPEFQVYPDKPNLFAWYAHPFRASAVPA